MATTTHNGFLLVMMDCPRSIEEEFNAWYDTEHIPERLAVPGIVSARRFVCQAGHPKYLAMYDLDAPEVMDSPDYLKVAHGNSSPWTKRVTGRVRVFRYAGRQVWPGNRVTQSGSRVAVLRFAGLNADAEPDLIAGLEVNMAGRPEIIQARLFTHDTGKGIDYLAMVEARAPLGERLDLAAFKGRTDALDLVNVYAPY